MTTGICANKPNRVAKYFTNRILDALSRYRFKFFLATSTTNRHLCPSAILFFEHSGQTRIIFTPLAVFSPALSVQPAALSCFTDVEKCRERDTKTAPHSHVKLTWLTSQFLSPS